MTLQNSRIYNDIFSYLNTQGYSTREVYDNEKVMAIVKKMVQQQVITFSSFNQIKEELNIARKQPRA